MEMKRRVHLVFLLVALIAAAAAMISATNWYGAARLGDSIARGERGEAPELRLVQAMKSARDGDAEAAIRAYKDVIENGREDIRQAALFDLGNLYLRQALRSGTAEADRYMPLIELAKQSYRTLLRANSDDWEARYNLEQALRLAPEYDEVAAPDAEALVPKERAVTTMQGHQLVLP
jgi:mxaK protein